MRERGGGGTSTSTRLPTPLTFITPSLPGEILLCVRALVKQDNVEVLADETLFEITYSTISEFSVGGVSVNRGVQRVQDYAGSFAHPSTAYQCDDQFQKVDNPPALSPKDNVLRICIEGENDQVNCDKIVTATLKQGTKVDNLIDNGASTGGFTAQASKQHTSTTSSSIPPNTHTLTHAHTHTHTHTHTPRPHHHSHVCVGEQGPNVHALDGHPSQVLQQAEQRRRPDHLSRGVSVNCRSCEWRTASSVRRAAKRQQLPVDHRRVDPRRGVPSARVARRCYRGTQRRCCRTHGRCRTRVSAELTSNKDSTQTCFLFFFSSGSSSFFVFFLAFRDTQLFFSRFFVFTTIVAVGGDDIFI